MRGRRAWLCLVVAVAACGEPPGAVPRGRTALTDRQVIVMYEKGVVPPALALDGNALSEVGSADMNGAVRAYQLPEGLGTSTAVAEIRRMPGVVDAVPNRPKSWSVRPNDPLLYRQWAITRAGSGLNAFALWDRRDDESKVTVAVLDSGVDYRHPELAGRVLLGANTLENNQDVMDRDGHGTHVAGIIGAAGNNGQGVAGVAWNVKILAIKVLDQEGGNDLAAIKGIQYAADNGARVINMSFNSEDTERSKVYQRAVDYARSKNVVVVGAAGNDHSQVTQPANTPGVLAVASLSTHGATLANYSNFGSAVHLAAPGDDIYSTLPEGRYGFDSGTSMSAPFVSAAAAIVISRHPDWLAEQVERAVLASVQGIPGYAGLGRLDLSRLP